MEEAGGKERLGKTENARKGRGGKKRRLAKVEEAQGGWRRFERIEQTRSQEARKDRGD